MWTEEVARRLDFEATGMEQFNALRIFAADIRAALKEIERLWAREAKLREEIEAQIEAWQIRNAGTNDDEKRLSLGVLLRLRAALAEEDR